MKTKHTLLIIFIFSLGISTIGLILDSDIPNTSEWLTLFEFIAMSVFFFVIISAVFFGFKLFGRKVRKSSFL